MDVKSKASTTKPELTNYACDKEALYYGLNQIIDLQNQGTTSVFILMLFDQGSMFRTSTMQSSPDN
jgi:hypothetical protein